MILKYTDVESREKIRYAFTQFIHAFQTNIQTISRKQVILFPLRKIDFTKLAWIVATIYEDKIESPKILNEILQLNAGFHGDTLCADGNIYVCLGEEVHLSDGRIEVLNNEGERRIYTT